MITNKIISFPTPLDTAEAVARLIVEKQQSKPQAASPLNVALSGGTTPELLFALLAEKYAAVIDWGNIRFFWVDERCVPSDHPQSNYGNAHTILFARVPIPPGNIFPMQGQDPPADEAVRYANVLKEQLPAIDTFPVFDLLLLGMGDDGHTASIFPDNPALLHSPLSVATAIHPKTGQPRITLTGNTICHAHHVVFLITGSVKAQVLEQIVREEGNYAQYPAYHIITRCGAELYVDNDAAGHTIMAR